MISDRERLHWILAQEVERSVRNFREQLECKHEWVNTEREVELLSSRIRGTFISSLVGETEQFTGKSFSKCLKLLPAEKTEEGTKSWISCMPTDSTPRDRGNIIWAMRILYTHGLGKISSIGDPKVKQYIEPQYCKKHFSSILLKDDELLIGPQVIMPAVKTILQLLDIYEESA